MSLVGNLEDLSLGDILQIISLSQKSGVLALSSDLGSGRIVFRTGMVQAACLKGHPNDLRALLVGEAVIDSAGYDTALARAQEHGIPVEDALSSEASIARDAIDELITKAAENAILEMFSWPSGDFSFDVRNELDPEDPHLILPNGINAQYLAMEGLRIRDERARDGGGDPDAETNPNIGADQDPLFGADLLEVEEDGDEDTQPVLEVDPLDPKAERFGGAKTPADALVEGVLARADEMGELSIDEIAKAMPLESDATLLAEVGAVADESAPLATEAPGPDPEPLVLEDEVEAPSETRENASPASAPSETRENAPPASAPVPGVPAPAPVGEASRMPVVLIDPDVTVLEWVKTAIEDDFARVHMFQKADQGLTRIRQYLIRGTTPLVLVSPETPIDPLSGIHGLADFVKRLKSQSPRIVVLGLREDDDGPPVAMPGVLNGVLSRPPRRLLAGTLSPEGASAGQALSRALLETLDRQGGGNAKAANTAESLRALRDATAKLQEASSRGEILPVVLDFAAEIFLRVAILVVRDEEIFAIAGRGISSLEVDPLGSADPVTMPMPDTGWLRRVLDGGKGFVAAPRDPSDHLLLEKLGGEVPERAYVGPIESGDAVIAMLYGDQSTSEAPMPDTHGLEVVLHHAGLALDRAALERALWEADGEAH